MAVNNGKASSNASARLRDELAALAAADNMTLRAAIATHYHWDHIGGAVDLGRRGGRDRHTRARGTGRVDPDRRVHAGLRLGSGGDTKRGDVYTAP